MADYPGYGQGMSGGSGIMSVLQPFGDYLNEQIDVQRVDPFLETVSNAAYQEFGIKPEQGGGFFSGGFYKDGGGLPDRDLFGGGGLPHPDEGFDFSNPVPNLPPPLPAVPNPGADNTNAFPAVGNNGLFGGGPMSGGTPTQLPGPRIPTFTGTGNAGFDIVSQGPLDFYNSNLEATVGMGYDGEFSGPSMQLPYDPTPMNPLIYNSLASAGILPDFESSAQDYFNPGMGGQRAYGPGALSSDRLVEMAQGRLAQRDVKPAEVQAYLEHIVQTGGNPTMMAPDMSNNSTNLAASPLSGFQGIGAVGPGGIQLARTQFG
mgnify:CR=1 FL=1